METVRLWRPVGENELALIRDAQFKRFPPRLDWQPISYPVLSEDYATRIAREWNTKDGGTGYVTTFEVDASFLTRYEPRAGGRELREYWIPAEDLEAFNAAIVGSIEVVAAYRGNPPERVDLPGAGSTPSAR